MRDSLPIDTSVRMGCSSLATCLKLLFMLTFKTTVAIYKVTWTGLYKSPQFLVTVIWKTDLVPWIFLYILKLNNSKLELWVDSSQQPTLMHLLICSPKRDREEREQEEQKQENSWIEVNTV